MTVQTFEEFLNEQSQLDEGFKDVLAGIGITLAVTGGIVGMWTGLNAVADMAQKAGKEEMQRKANRVRVISNPGIESEIHGIVVNKCHSNHITLTMNDDIEIDGKSYELSDEEPVVAVGNAKITGCHNPGCQAYNHNENARVDVFDTECNIILHIDTEDGELILASGDCTVTFIENGEVYYETLEGGMTNYKVSFENGHFKFESLGKNSCGGSGGSGLGRSGSRYGAYRGMKGPLGTLGRAGL